MGNWSWQVTLGDVLAILLAAVGSGAGWAYAHRQRRDQRADALRTTLLADVRRHLRNTSRAANLPMSPDWHELAELLPRQQRLRLRKLLKGYRVACSSTHQNSLGEVLYNEPRRVRVHLLLLVRLLRRPSL